MPRSTSTTRKRVTTSRGAPPDRQPRGAEFVDVEDETLSMRVMQEEPDEVVDDEALVGGDDPDAIPADEDVLGGDAFEEEDESLDLRGETGPEAGAMHLE